MSIPFIDLQAQRKRLEPELTIALQRVMERGDFIQGQEVGEFETSLADFCGAKHVVSCANGTDALTLVGMAENIGPGDAVFVPAFTFAATAEAFIILGAMPFFVDVDPGTFNMDAGSLIAGIEDAKKQNLTPRMVVAVDIFGQPANYTRLAAVAREEGLVLIADAAQALGAQLGNKRVGTLADYTTTSFFPAKPLGCYGDGGAVLTDNADKAGLIKSLTQHGKGAEKYDNVRIGLNSRLDTLQAAILLEKLKIYEEELVSRNVIAQRYTEELSNIATTPVLLNDATSIWAIYTLKLDNRNDVQAKLKTVGIPTAVYYPLPLNQQGGYSDCPVSPGGVPVAETLSSQVLSLPMHAYLSEDVQEFIIGSLKEAASE